MIPDSPNSDNGYQTSISDNFSDPLSDPLGSRPSSVATEKSEKILNVDTENKNGMTDGNLEKNNRNSERDNYPENPTAKQSSKHHGQNGTDDSDMKPEWKNQDSGKEDKEAPKSSDQNGTDVGKSGTQTAKPSSPTPDLSKENNKKSSSIYN